MHLPPQESPTPELKQPPLPMTPGDDERSTTHLQAIPPDAIPPDLSTTSSTSTPLLCAVCCVLSAGCDLPYAATPPTHTPPPLVLFSNIPGERVFKRVRPPCMADAYQTSAACVRGMTRRGACLALDSR